MFKVSSLGKKFDELTNLVKNLSTSSKSADIASSTGSKSENLTTNASIQRPPDIQGFQISSPLKDLEELLDKKFSGLNIKPIDLSNDFANQLESTSDLKNQTKLELNKLRGIIRKQLKSQIC